MGGGWRWWPVAVFRGRSFVYVVWSASRVVIIVLACRRARVSSSSSHFVIVVAFRRRRISSSSHFVVLACCRRAHVSSLSPSSCVGVVVLMCRAWVVAGVVPVMVRTEEWGGGAYVPLAHDVATSWVLSLVLGPSFHAGGVVVVSVGIVPLDWDWTQESGWQSSGSPVDWTGLDWTGLQWTGHSASQSGLVRGPLESTGIHWSPLESTGVHMDYVGEGKDLIRLTNC
ncbi:uncharacterized protein LACBIDRAFT_321474 [Laccaria bicolor S238N-H82]|uniref:Predicted protein n=1 Tax=Laccaria bicolor (strain S238N-H82 / ATCC MYA-4686) TaxID=486041 RepID=B0CT11_LACBS|nr:uncharacterized protein LACBIDRAFT_321474 [Laccaria bicolor S238N-H82]EDR13857.1 predicted protein [Laccaria bicolor S238N-H82]|eukprot:XP_001874416.1 predicted protein [Laccaria bicolor S238N-H82]